MAHLYLAYQSENNRCAQGQTRLSTDTLFLLQQVRQECERKETQTFFVVSYINGSEHRELSYVATLDAAIEFARRYSQDGQRVSIDSHGQTPGLMITEWDMDGFDNLSGKNLLHNIYTGQGNLVRSFRNLSVIK
jgi:hypothetical protein